MSVMSASTAVPDPSAAPTSERASARDSSRERMNAPLPLFTSRSRAVAPIASFFDMIDAVIRGSDSTVPVTSRSAYIRRSAGAISAVEVEIAQPADSTQRSSSSRERRGLKPGIVSSLSSVPPVCPSPRPESIAILTPHEATRGESGSEILSPTPPVECLSATKSKRSRRRQLSPDSSIARVRAAVSYWLMPRIAIAMRKADIW
jgi:hypothetical protein